VNRILALLLSLVLALAATLFAAPAARAQNPDDTVHYVDPVTKQREPIQEGERRQRVEELRGFLAETDANRLVILTTGDQRSMVPLDRLPKIASWMVANGKATPAEAAGWIEDQKARSRLAAEALRELLQALQGAEGVILPTPAGSDYFPSPMDWLEVRGLVRGTYRIRCYLENNKQLPDYRGTFTIELVGDGTVRGTYEDEGLQYQTGGNVSYMGGDYASLSGRGPGLLGSTFRWDARVYREGNKIMMMANANLFLDPDPDTNSRCDPGYVEQTE
jgi:hypothetical protein